MQVLEKSSIRVLIVDDHELFMTGLSSVLQREPGLTVIGQATNKTEALSAAALRPDIILLDLDLGKENSLEFLPELLTIGDGARVIAVTGVPDPELHLRAVRLGAMGVVLKIESSAFLIKAIRKVYSGEVWLNNSLVSTVMTELLHANTSKKVDPEAEKIASLTEREHEVIALLAEGRRNKQIGEQLFISEKTVRHYLTSIFEKLGVTDRLALMIYAYKYGLAKLSAPAPHPTDSTRTSPK